MDEKTIQAYKDMSQLEKTVFFRDAITQFHVAMKELPDAIEGEEFDKVNPLKHTFGDGFYMREIMCPKDQVIITKIHKKENPLFLMKGKCTIITENGAVDWEAPKHHVTQPGTQRIIRTWEDCVFITVHPTQAKDLVEAEEELIAKSFDDPEIKIENNNTKKIKI